MILLKEYGKIKNLWKLLSKAQYWVYMFLCLYTSFTFSLCIYFLLFLSFFPFFSMQYICYSFDFLKIILQAKQQLAYSAHTTHFSNLVLNPIQNYRQQILLKNLKFKLKIHVVFTKKMLLKIIIQSIVINAINGYLSHLTE